MRVAVLLSAAFVLSACATATETVLTSPPAVRPKPVATTPASTGSLFPTALGQGIPRPLFEDRRARVIGDTLSKALAAWRDDGGTLDVTRLALAWGPLQFAGDGTLALDAENRPMGAATARIAGYGETIDALAQSGAIQPTVGALMKVALNFLARVDPLAGNRSVVAVPISAQDGFVSVERFKLFRIPPLKLD